MGTEIERLGYLMVKHGAAIRAVPEVTRTVLEKNKADDTGYLKYLPKYKRVMFIKETVPANAGKFLLSFKNREGAAVKFSNKRCFDTIEDIIKYLETLEQEKENKDVES